MTDDEPPATRADFERLAAETADRAYALHAEVLATMTARLLDLERSVGATVRDATEHGLRVQRAELRVLRHTLGAAGGESQPGGVPKADGGGSAPAITGHRPRAAVVLAFGAAVTIAVAVALVCVLG